ncbi:hypothetical protein [Candidatus Poriferisocius sp.]|uniref:hypothetical protein n=1 Tax=Candidatus Poriferisocius sp. TaxID=3101276 RepID=UPI003B02CFB6
METVTGPNRAGRKRECDTMVLLVHEVAAWMNGSYPEADDQYKDPAHWTRICDTRQAAHPDTPKYWMSRKPVNRSQNFRFRKKLTANIQTKQPA